MVGKEVWGDQLSIGVAQEVDVIGVVLWRRWRRRRQVLSRRGLVVLGRGEIVHGQLFLGGVDPWLRMMEGFRRLGNRLAGRNVRRQGRREVALGEEVARGVDAELVLVRNVDLDVDGVRRQGVRGHDVPFRVLQGQGDLVPVDDYVRGGVEVDGA